MEISKEEYIERLEESLAIYVELALIAKRELKTPLTILAEKSINNATKKMVKYGRKKAIDIAVDLTAIMQASVYKKQWLEKYEHQLIEKEE